MKRFLCIIFMLFGLVGTIVSAIQFGMALKYGELGRVAVYLILTVYCIILAGVLLYHLLKTKKQR